MATAVPYNNFYEYLLNGSFDATGDTVNVMLLTSSYTPDIDTDVFVDDIIAAEVSGTGYTTGGQALSSVGVTLDNTNDLAYVDADDPAWSASTITCRYAVFYKDTGASATDVLISYIDFASNQSSSASTFTITIPADGFLQCLTMSAASGVYFPNTFYRDLLSGVHDFTNDTHYMMLLTSSYTPDIDADEHRDDINANEVSGTGYSAGGVAMSANAVSQDNTNDRGVVDWGDVTFSTVSITAQFAAIYQDTGNAATDNVIMIIDFGSDQTATAADFVVTLDSNGLLTAEDYA